MDTLCLALVLICVGVRHQFINGGKTIANGAHTVNKDGVGVFVYCTSRSSFHTHLFGQKEKEKERIPSLAGQFKRE